MSQKFTEAFSKFGPQLAKVITVGSVGIGGSVWAFKNCLFNVDAGHRAIKFSRIGGLKEDLYTEGTHVMVPWFERPITFDIRTKPRTLVSLTGSKDLQMVSISLRTLCRPREDKLPAIYRYVGTDYDEKVLPSIINEVLKSVVAQFNASELVTQREVVSRRIRQELVERAREFNLILDDVAIVDLAFSPEYAGAVEQKQVAQQQAEKAKYQVLKAQEMKKNIIIKAQGEMESAKMIGSAIQNNPGFVELRKIDAAKEIAHHMAVSRNKMVLNSDSLLLNLMSSGNESMSNIYVAEPPTKGKVVLHTTHGPISIALWSKECPKATRNFVQLALEDYYNGTLFHRIIKDFLIQGGDRTNTGLGCDSIYGEPYPNEFHSRLKFRYRGLVGVASAGVAEKGGASTNGSQFFITMGRDDSFNNKYTLFGKVVDDTVYNLDRISQANVDTNDYPTDDPPPHIIRAEVVENPFTDIIPRDIYRQVVDHAEEERDNRRKEKIEVSNKKGLLSFEDEDSSSSESEDDEDGNEKRIAVKVKSAHDGGDASLLAETAKSGDAADAVQKGSSSKAAARRAKMLQKSRGVQDLDDSDEESEGSEYGDRERAEKLGILPSEAKAMRESELERQRQIEKMRQKIRQVNRVEDTSKKETKGPMGIADRANKYKRREKRGKKAYQELDVFMTEEASKAHEREEEGPEVVNGESSTSARAEDTEITAEPGTLAETMQFAFGEDTGALGADGDAFGASDWLHGRDTSAHSKGLKFAIDSTRAYQLDEERAQKVLEVYDPLDPNAGPPKERREENRPKRPRRDDDDERSDRHHRHHR